MDPDEALRQMVESAGEVLHAREDDDAFDQDACDSNEATVAKAALALDEWIRKGGFLPAAWTALPDDPLEALRLADDAADRARLRVEELVPAAIAAVVRETFPHAFPPAVECRFELEDTHDDAGRGYTAIYLDGAYDAAGERIPDEDDALLDTDVRELAEHLLRPTLYDDPRARTIRVRFPEEAK